MTPINIQISRSKVKVKPILDKLGKGGISVSQTSIFDVVFSVQRQLSWTWMNREGRCSWEFYWTWWCTTTPHWCLVPYSYCSDTSASDRKFSMPSSRSVPPPFPYTETDHAQLPGTGVWCLVAPIQTLQSETNRIYHCTPEGTRESHPSVHDLQSSTRLAESWMSQIMDRGWDSLVPSGV